MRGVESRVTYDNVEHSFDKEKLEINARSIRGNKTRTGDPGERDRGGIIRWTVGILRGGYEKSANTSGSEKSNKGKPRQDKGNFERRAKLLKGLRRNRNRTMKTRESAVRIKESSRKMGKEDYANSRKEDHENSWRGLKTRKEVRGTERPV